MSLPVDPTASLRGSLTRPAFHWDATPPGQPKQRAILFVCKRKPLVVTQMFDLARSLLLEPPRRCAQVRWTLYFEDHLSDDEAYVSFMTELTRQPDDLDGHCAAPGPPRPLVQQVRLWPTAEILQTDGRLSLPDIDLMITLGGDGTVLYAAWLFQHRPVPPVLPLYAHGSLGFLTVFDVPSCPDWIESIAESSLHRPSGVYVNLRMRLRCSIVRNSGAGALADGHTIEDRAVSPLTESYHVLNELVLDRGPSPFMTHIELYGDGRHLTTVQADGLVVATPTGSTAYSLSAGGSIVHPAVPAMLVTPICPHTLSFRPLILPDSMVLEAVVASTARAPLWASFDGRCRVPLERGDLVRVVVSSYPVPTLCNVDQTHEWFTSLSRCLHWNERRLQQA